jgi:hypothetical protein
MAKSLSITIIILLCIIKASANYKAKGYRSLDDYLNSRYENITLESIEMQTQTMSDGSDEKTYLLFAEDINLQKLIRHNYWAVEIDSNLLLNSRVALNETTKAYDPPYTPVFFRNAKYIIFRGKYNKNYKGIRTTTANGSTLVPIVGILGAAIITKATAKSKPSSMPDRLDYLLDLKTKDIIYFNRGILRRYLDDAVTENDTAAVKFLAAALKARE